MEEIKNDIAKNIHNKAFIVKRKKTVASNGENLNVEITSLEIAKSIQDIINRNKGRVESVKRYHIDVILHNDQGSMILVSDH